MKIALIALLVVPVAIFAAAVIGILKPKPNPDTSECSAYAVKGIQVKFCAAPKHP